MGEAAQWLENYGVSAIDINMGCPVHKVTRSGGGSALMCNVTSSVRLVRTIVEAVAIPVTVKMRLGWDDTDWSAPLFAREFEQAGVAAVIIHGRTRAQGFGGAVNLDGIRRVVEAVDRLPVEKREVVGLIYYHGWTQAEVAEHLGLSKRTVQRHWAAAMLTLHALLKDR